jgi:hypothetical protein
LTTTRFKNEKLLFYYYLRSFIKSKSISNLYSYSNNAFGGTTTEDDDDDKGFFLRPELGETVGGAGKHEMFFTTTSAFSAERRFGRVKTDVGYGFRVRVWYSLRLGIQSLVREHVPYANVADGVPEDDVSIVRGKRRA